MASARSLFVLAFAAVLWSAASASAQSSDDERARGHFLAGSSYFDQGRYDQAAEQFETAYSLSPRSQLLLNAAAAY
jgi:Tfp pilus assembly protein PilF